MLSVHFMLVRRLLTLSVLLKIVSSLDALEREEEAHFARMRRISQAPAPEPIGLAASGSASATSRGGAQGDDSQEPSQDTTTQPSPRPRFWNLRRASRRTSDVDVSQDTDDDRHQNREAATPHATRP